MIIDCHGHYTTAPGALQKFRDEQIAALKTGLDVPLFAQAKISDDEIRDSLENAQLKLQRARGTDLTIFSPRASAMAHHIGNETTSRRWTQSCNDLIHRVVAPVSGQFRRRLSVAAIAGGGAGQQRRGTRALRQGAGIHRLQSESGSFRGPLDIAAADRSALVSAVREDGGARRARHGACEFLVQPEFSRHRRALHQCRYHGLHAVPDQRSVCGFSDAAVHHSARRRRGSLSLGPIPRTRPGHEAAAAAGLLAQERVLRYLCLSSAGHRTAAQGDSRRQHPVRLGDGRRGARHRSAKPDSTSTTPSATWMRST